MMERGILFSGDMVRAILAGRKTQTRRVVTDRNVVVGGATGTKLECFDLERAWVDGKDSGSEYLHAPLVRGPQGDQGIVDRLYPRIAPALCWDQRADPDEAYVPPASRLWVRETWAGDENYGVVYRADHPDADLKRGDLDDGEQSIRRWKPSIHMPRWASRITLDVTAVRVERVRDIGRDGRKARDVLAEGVTQSAIEREAQWFHPDDAPAMAFARVWDALNAKRGYGWDTNPFVWVITFRAPQEGASPTEEER